MSHIWRCSRVSILNSAQCVVKQSWSRAEEIKGSRSRHIEYTGSWTSNRARSKPHPIAAGTVQLENATSSRESCPSRLVAAKKAADIPTGEGYRSLVCPHMIGLCDASLDSPPVCCARRFVAVGRARDGCTSALPVSRVHPPPWMLFPSCSCAIAFFTARFRSHSGFFLALCGHRVLASCVVFQCCCWLVVFISP